MKNEIAIIKKYATDSIEFGKKSGNQVALKRGDAVMLAISKIETESSMDREFKNMYKRWYENETETNNQLVNQLVKNAGR